MPLWTQNSLSQFSSGFLPSYPTRTVLIINCQQFIIVPIVKSCSQEINRLQNNIGRWNLLHQVKEILYKNEAKPSRSAHKPTRTRNYYDHPVTYYCRHINTHNDNKKKVCERNANKIRIILSLPYPKRNPIESMRNV